MSETEGIAALEAIERHAGERPHHTALIDSTRKWTYAALKDAAERAARHVGRAPAGFPPLLLVMESSCPAAAWMLGAVAAGYAPILVPRTLPALEFSDLRRDAGEPPVVECWSGKMVAGRVSAPGWTARPLFAQMTSGSTGPSRLAVRSAAGVAAEIEAVRARLGFGPADRVLCLSSIVHSYGLCGALLGGLTAGATVYLAPGAEAHAAWKQFRPTIVFGLGPLYARLPALPAQAVDEARFVLSAGAPLPAGVFERWREERGILIRQDYGTTETGTITIDASSAPAPDRAGTPLPHLGVRLAPAEGGRREVLARGPAVAMGYLAGAELVPAVDTEGWYHTGDAGTLAGDTLLLQGRVFPPIDSAGVALNPALLEAELGAIPGVREAAVLAMEREVRVAVAGDESLRGTLVAWCRHRLPDTPSRISIVDALPRSPAGKVLRKYLP